MANGEEDMEKKFILVSLEIRILKIILYKVMQGNQ